VTHYKNILVKRDQLLGPNLPTFYDQPVHLVKGKDVWVWDIDGKKYDSPNAGISEAIFAYISGIKLGGKSKYKNEIIEKPIINKTGDYCTEEKIKLICQ